MRLMLIKDTPFGRIHRTLNYGIAANRDTTTRSHIRWSADTKTVYFDGCALVLKDLIAFIHELLQIAEVTMAKRLLFQVDEDIPEFDLEVMDNPSNHDAGYYFGLREPDAWNKARMRMVQWIRKAKVEGEWFEHMGDAMEISEAARDEYCRCIVNELIVLIPLSQLRTLYMMIRRRPVQPRHLRDLGRAGSATPRICHAEDLPMWLLPSIILNIPYLPFRCLFEVRIVCVRSGDAVAVRALS